MGYETKSDCEGESPVEMECNNSDCDTDTFWTDEIDLNTCPECNVRSMTPS